MSEPSDTHENRPSLICESKPKREYGSLLEQVQVLHSSKEGKGIEGMPIHFFLIQTWTTCLEDQLRVQLAAGNDGATLESPLLPDGESHPMKLVLLRSELVEALERKVLEQVFEVELSPKWVESLIKNGGRVSADHGSASNAKREMSAREWASLFAVSENALQTSKLAAETKLARRRAEKTILKAQLDPKATGPSYREEERGPSFLEIITPNPRLPYYKDDTPGERLDKSFNNAFRGCGSGCAILGFGLLGIILLVLLILAFS